MRRLVFGLAIALASVGVAGAEAQAQSAGWRFERLVDPISDEVRGVASVRSGDYSLVFKCDFGTPGVYVDFYSRRSKLMGRLGGADGRRNVLHRFDRDEPQTQSWYFSTSGSWLLWSENTVAFARRAMGASRLVLRVSEPGRADEDAIFDLTGSGRAISSVYRACGLPVPGA